MKLLYDKNDLAHAAKLRDRRLAWLCELGADELSATPLDVEGFLFAYQQGGEHYSQLVANRPGVHDRPEARSELIHLDVVLDCLAERGVDVPMPRTWVIRVDDAPRRTWSFPCLSGRQDPHGSAAAAKGEQTT